MSNDADFAGSLPEIAGEQLPFLSGYWKKSNLSMYNLTYLVSIGDV